MCVAMRQGLSWSFDIDTYGVCAAAHVLFFGSHMKIKMNKDKRWMPEECFRRYHNTPLWTEIFDTLLNLEEGTQSAIGSRPRSLRQLRGRIEDYLSEERQSAKLERALKHQADMLPTTRLT